MKFGHCLRTLQNSIVLVTAISGVYLAIRPEYTPLPYLWSRESPAILYEYQDSARVLPHGAEDLRKGIMHPSRYP